MLTVTEVAQPLTERDLEQFEISFGINLPQEYRQFLLKYNGGHVEPSAFHYSSMAGCGNITGPLDKVGIISSFFSLNTETTMDLATIREGLPNTIPDNLLMIGGTATGNILCLSVYGADQGFMYIWHKNQGYDLEEWEEPNCDYIYFAADNFDTFLNSLYEYEDET